MTKATSRSAGHLRGQVVDLVGDADRGGDHREVLAPAFEQPQPDGLDDLDHRVPGGGEREPGQGAGVEREGVLDEAEQLGVVDVEAELAQERPQLRAGRGRNASSIDIRDGGEPPDGDRPGRRRRSPAGTARPRTPAG